MESNKEDIKKDSYIFTDSYKTKDLIWDAYDGFVETYNNYIMLNSLNRVDPITKSRLFKYSVAFHGETKHFFEKFEKELKKEKIEECNSIFEKSDINSQDYKFLRDFFGKFMIVSGIKNIVIPKDDIGETIKKNR